MGDIGSMKSEYDKLKKELDGLESEKRKLNDQVQDAKEKWQWFIDKMNMC